MIVADDAEAAVAPAKGLRGFFGLTRVGAAFRPIGTTAATLPSEADARYAVGLVAHVYSTPLREVWAMPLRELAAWAHDAIALLRRLHAK